MITRRSFFKAIGTAVLGTAIALKLPETIVARIPSITYGISYHQLLQVYNRGCGDGFRRRIEDEPKYIYLSPNRFINTLEKFKEVFNLIPNHHPKLAKNEFEFMGATVMPAVFVSDDDIVLVGHLMGASHPTKKMRIADIYRGHSDRVKHLSSKYIQLNKNV